MAVVVTVLVWLLTIGLILVLLVLILPLSLRASGAFAPWQATGQVDVSWGFGLLGFRLSRARGGRVRVLGISIFRIKADDDSKEKKKDAKKDIKNAGKKKKKRGARWAWRNQTLFYRLGRALHIRGTLRGIIGLGDPANTAKLAMLLEPAAERLPGFSARLAWDYMDEVLFVDAKIEARIWPIELVFILLAALARRGSRRALLAKY